MFNCCGPTIIYVKARGPRVARGTKSHRIHPDPEYLLDQQMKTPLQLS